MTEHLIREGDQDSEPGTDCSLALRHTCWDLLGVQTWGGAGPQCRGSTLQLPTVETPGILTKRSGTFSFCLMYKGHALKCWGLSGQAPP